MYVGRIVAAAMTADGRSAVMYRVSSRSFPNREARIDGGAISIMPRPGHEDDLSKNPYIAYNCLKTAGDWAVASNGSHTDPIAEKIASGMSVRDAFALTLMTMDYEKDSYNTPRIAAAVNRSDNAAFLGIVRKDAVIVREFELKPGIAYYTATYEHNVPCEHYKCESFDAADAASACEFVISGAVFAELENPVTAAAAIVKEDSFETAVLTP